MTNTFNRTTDLPKSPDQAGAPAIRGEVVQQSDTTDLTRPYKFIYVGGTGDVKVLHLWDDDAAPVVYKAFPAGAYLIAHVRRVFLTGTSATNMVGATE